MNAKQIITLFLMAFVAVSIATALLNEFRTDPSEGSVSGEALAELDEDNPSEANAVFEESGLAESGGETIPEASVPENPQPNRLIVYYFHRSIRCAGCINVETAAYEAAVLDHAEEIAEGILEWHSINFDEPEHEHFIEEYNLYYQALIFAEVRSGEVIRWNDMAEVWQHWSNSVKAREIVSEQIDQWLEEIRSQ